MQITFIGATGTVTGSKYLVNSDNQQFLIDCGLFQGYKELRLRNWAPFPFSPAAIKAVILTHAHLDHTGALPLLVKQGFTGPILATSATRDLCAILLPDSGFLQEEDAWRANKYGYSKHTPALPLYTKEEAIFSLKQFQPLGYGVYRQLNELLSFQFQRAGHIIGSSLLTLRENNTTLLFTGDLGRPHDPVMKPPAIIQHVDYLVIESTYGDRLHEKENTEEKIALIVNQTVKRGGTVVIPAFAVGRAQSLLYYMYCLKKAKKIPDVPIFLDSPMAVDATHLFNHYTSEHRLSPALTQAVCKIATYVNTTDDSRAIDAQPMPKIIISASGMASGGRVLHHLKAFLPESRNTILLTGFQAGGTRGDRLLRGETAVKIHGEMTPVRAQIAELTNTSAHADYEEIIAWLKNFNRPPRKVFITHGEPDAANALKQKIIEQFGWNCAVPEYLQTENL